MVKSHVSTLPLGAHDGEWEDDYRHGHGTYTWKDQRTLWLMVVCTRVISKRAWGTGRVQWRMLISRTLWLMVVSTLRCLRRTRASGKRARCTKEKWSILISELGSWWWGLRSDIWGAQGWVEGWREAREGQTLHSKSANLAADGRTSVEILEKIPPLLFGVAKQGGVSKQHQNHQNFRAFGADFYLIYTVIIMLHLNDVFFGCCAPQAIFF